MYSQIIYRERFSIRIVIILFFVDLFERFNKNIEIWLLNSLIKSFNKLSRIHNILIAKQHIISKKSAVRWLKSISEPLSMIDRYESGVNKTNNAELSESFKAYKKSLFRFEATLHKIATSENPIIETPDYLKRGLSKMGLTSTLSNLD
jgi:hypothetical protein